MMTQWRMRLMTSTPFWFTKSNTCVSVSCRLKYTSWKTWCIRSLTQHISGYTFQPRFWKCGSPNFLYRWEHAKSLRRLIERMVFNRVGGATAIVTDEIMEFTSDTICPGGRESFPASGFRQTSLSRILPIELLSRALESRMLIQTAEIAQVINYRHRIFLIVWIYWRIRYMCVVRGQAVGRGRSHVVRHELFLCKLQLSGKIRGGHKVKLLSSQR